MAKRRSRIMPKGLTKEIITNANPSKGAAEFAFPRTAEDGISLANLGLDIGDWYAPATTYATEVASGRQEFSPLTAGLLVIPGIGQGAKKLKKVSDFAKLFPEGQFSKASIKAAEKLEPEFIKLVNFSEAHPTTASKAYKELQNLAQINPEAYQLLIAKHGYNRQFEKGIDKVLQKPENYNKYTPKEQTGWDFLETNRIGDITNSQKGGTALTSQIQGIPLHKDYQISSEKYITQSDLNANGKADLPNLITGDFEAIPGNRYQSTLNMLEANPEFDYRLADKRIKEAEDAAKVQSLDKFEDKSSGIIHQEHNPDPVATGATKKSYDHSRPFNGGNFQKLEPVDRQTLMKDDYDLGQRMYDAQSDFTGVGSINEGRDQRAAALRYPRNRMQDPYYNAGVINDKNARLNALIDRERKNGMSDAEIYKKYKDEFDSYQGDVERFKTRIANSENPSKLTLDGAKTDAIRATASEKIDVMRKLGIDPNNPRAEEILDKYMQFYDDLQKRYLGIPGTPREDMFGRLLDIDYYDKLKQLKK